MTTQSPVSLPDFTSLGYVHLTVSNLANSLQFYQQVLGLQVQEQTETRAKLGVGGARLLVLTEVSGAVLPARHTGLYHFAILTPSRAALAGFLNHLVVTKTPVQGASDHGVSEAIYLPDPDGNGIEVYRDRPRDEWKMGADGNLALVNGPLDVDGVLGTLNNNSPWRGMEPDTTLGHIHLHVSDLAASREFYFNILGFDLIADWVPSALFMSAGGYHHHIGLNVWNGTDIPAPPADSIGLRYFTIRVGSAALVQLESRLQDKAIAFEERKDGIFVHDPAQNGLLFIV